MPQGPSALTLTEEKTRKPRELRGARGDDESMAHLLDAGSRPSSRRSSMSSQMSRQAAEALGSTATAPRMPENAHSGGPIILEARTPTPVASSLKGSSNDHVMENPSQIPFDGPKSPLVLGAIESPFSIFRSILIAIMVLSVVGLLYDQPVPGSADLDEFSGLDN